VSPLIFVAVGTILVGLGVSGPVPIPLGILGAACLLFGLSRIRWRNDVLNWTFWGTLSLLGALVGVLALLAAQVRVPFIHLLAIAVLQAAVAVGLATGVRDCLLAGGADAADPRLARLLLARALVVATFASTVISVLVDGLLFEVPAVTLLVIAILAMLAYLWLGVLMFKLRDEPSLQADSAGRA
jgi:hypothetical protein